MSLTSSFSKLSILCDSIPVVVNLLYTTWAGLEWSLEYWYYELSPMNIPYFSDKKQNRKAYRTSLRWSYFSDRNFRQLYTSESLIWQNLTSPQTGMYSLMCLFNHFGIWFLCTEKVMVPEIFISLRYSKLNNALDLNAVCLHTSYIYVYIEVIALRQSATSRQTYLLLISTFGNILKRGVFVHPLHNNITVVALELRKFTFRKAFHVLFTTYQLELVQ